MGKKTKKELNALEYYRSLPLYEWFEEFCSTYAKNGTLAYATVWQFIQKKTKVDRQRKILWWLLGPEASEGDHPYDIPQLDWVAKRRQGFWFGTKDTVDLVKRVNSQMSSLAAVSEAGKVNVDVITNLKMMLFQLDNEMGGQLFLQGMDAAENNARVNMMLTVKERILTMLTVAQTMYAKSQGIDFANLEALQNQFGQMMLPTLLGKAAESGMHRAENETAHKLAKMLMDKSVNYSEEGITLPDKQMEEAVIAINKKPRGKPN